MFQKDLFKNKIAIITGGGSGIGYEIAQQLLEYGASVWIASRNEEKLQKAQEKLSLIGDCKYISIDIRQPQRIEEAITIIKSQSKTIDILINNAGGQFRAAAEDITNKGWDAVIHNNLNGTWYMTQAISKAFFIPQNQGKIINIIAQIHRGFPGMIHTGAARAGVDNLTKTLAVEWSKYGIQVNAIAPGVIRTSGLDTYPDEVRQYTLEQVPKKIPAKRLGTAQEITALALFLASPLASYITGETIYADGGQRLWGDFWELP